MSTLALPGTASMALVVLPCLAANLMLNLRHSPRRAVAARALLQEMV